MFIGHFGVAFAAKAAAQRVSLGTLMLASQLIDLLWPIFLALGWERVRINNDPASGLPLQFEHYPITHSLLAVAGWAVLCAAIHFIFRRSYRNAAILAALVLSHWVLDLIVHVPDLPILPGEGQFVGFGLWSLPLVALMLEILILLGGVWYYAKVTKPADRTGIWSLAALVLFLVSIQIANTFGSAPPSLAALIWVGQAQWLLVLWGYWVDKHRESVTIDSQTCNPYRRST